MELSKKKCKPCNEKVKPLPREKIYELLNKLNEKWMVGRNDFGPPRLYRNWKFKSFKESMSFLNKVAKISEEQGHHPDFRLEDYNKVNIVIYTHSIDNLSENDFILAAKIDNI